MQKISAWFTTSAIALTWMALALPASAQWKKLVDCGGSVTSVYFLNELGYPALGFAGASNGIWRTQDGGATWDHVSTLPFQPSQFVFKDAQTGWCSSRASDQSYVTHDGGSTWQRMNLAYSGEGIAYNSFTQLLFVTSWHNAYCVSNDDGATWTIHDTWTPFGFYPSGVSFGTPTNGLMTGASNGAGGGYGPTLFTTDGGVTWQQSNNFQVENWQPLMIRGSREAYSIFDVSGGLYHSTDGGINWSRIQTALLSPQDYHHNNGPLGDIEGDSCRLYYQSGGSSDGFELPGGVWVSRNGGSLWHFLHGPFNGNVHLGPIPGFFDVRFFVYDRTIYAGDTLGGVWKYVDDHPIAEEVCVLMDRDSVNFDTISRCDVRSVTIHLQSDLRCDSITIVPIWDQTDAAITSPVNRTMMLGPNGRDSLEIHYAPTIDGKTSAARLRLRLTFEGTTNDTVIALEGVSAVSPHARVQPASLVLDTISVCDSAHGLLVLRNPGCDSIQVSILSLPGSGFSMGASFAPHTLGPLSADSLSINYHPSGSGTGFSFVQIHCIPAVGSAYDITVSLQIEVKPGTSAIAALDSVLDLGNISICSHASGVIHFASVGCDSLRVSGEAITSGNGWALANPHQAVLAIGASDSSMLTFYPPGIGSYSTDVIIQTSAGNKTVHVTARGVPDSGRVTLSTLALNLGSVTASCDSSASQFTFTNTTCNPVTIDSVSAISNAFSRSSLSLPKLLASDSSTTVHVGFSPTATGTFAANLHLYFHGPDNREHDTIIALQGIGTSGATLGVELKPTTLSAQAGGAIDLPIYLDGALDAANAKAIGLQSVVMSLAWNTDLFSPMSATASIAGATVTNYSASNGNVDLAIALPAGFTFSGPTPLAIIHCQAFITDTLRTIAELARLTFNVAHNCLTLAAPNGSTPMVLNTICSDSTISKTMAHGLAFAIESIVPNPTTGMLTISLIGEQHPHYELYDLLGNLRMSGELTNRTLDLHTLTSGSYYLRLSESGQVLTRRIVRE